jgi:NTE family protein
MDAARAPRPHHRQLLEQHLRALLGTLEPALMTQLHEHLRWLELDGGDTLLRQGEPGDSMYLLVGGRLRAYVDDDDGVRQPVREIGRGEVVGEISLYTDEPRSTTLVAVRDSVLVRLGKADFLRLLAGHPALSAALTRSIVHRLRTEVQRAPLAPPAMLGVLAISDGVDLGAFARELAAQIERIGRRVCVVDGAAAGEAGDDVQRLDEIEATHDVVLLVGDAPPGAWTDAVGRHCDELLLVGDATAAPALQAIERRRPQPSGAAEILVLLHGDTGAAPRGTRAWLALRPFADHVHVRRGVAADMARLARLQTRTAIGLVCAGGGARGFAHLGVWQALRERGIEIDCVGGTSIGAVMAAYVASDRPARAVLGNARRWFKRNPTGDWNALPLMSLIKGRRLRSIVDGGVRELFGGDVDIEDLTKNFYCVASNYSQAREVVLRRGSLVQALLASVAIPGALPPTVHDGDLLCDGGSFNNFPVDVMRSMRGVATVIGVDLQYSKPRRIELDAMPGTWALLRDKLRPRAARRYRLPSLAAYLMNTTILYSASRQKQGRRLSDLYFNPPLPRIGMLEWHRFDAIVEQGLAHGREVLAAVEPGRFGAGAT